MEAHGMPACIQVTHGLYLALRDDYVLHERGTVDIKGKGPTTTYLLTGRLDRTTELAEG
jgi:hypothetical protein